MSTDTVADELMRKIRAYTDLDPSHRDREYIELEQAIRRAVDWEQVAELRGDMKGGGHVHWLSEKTFEPGTPLYARSQHE